MRATHEGKDGPTDDYKHTDHVALNDAELLSRLVSLSAPMSFAVTAKPISFFRT
jgi:hypothetical protein